jgi:hypothetical protein
VALKDLTIVILSRGREEILKKTLNYWSDKAPKVLVLHNTNHPLAVADIPKNVEYVVERISYGERCGQVPKYLKTKYAILSSDDEVFLTSALKKMVGYMENNNSMESVGGSVIAIGKYGPRTTGTHCYSNMERYENIKRSRKSRLTEHFDTDLPWRGGSMYRVISRPLFNKMMKMFQEISVFSTPYIFEVSGEILVNSSGKTKYLQEIYWIRNWIIEPVVHKDWDRKKYFSSWFTDPNNKKEVSEWRCILSKSLGISAEDLNSVLHKVFTLRDRSESREIERSNEFRLPLPTLVKYLVRKLTNSHSMPGDFHSTLAAMQRQGINFSSREIEAAVRVINS